MNPTDGVYFRREDYAPFWRRVLIDVVDFLIVGLVCLLAIAAWTALLPRGTNNILLAGCAVFVFCYFVLLKRSKIGTVGYRIGGVRVVGLDGQPASIFALTVRLLFAPLGPGNWLFDLIWLSGDEHRQALRDKFTQTYVVKLQAEPAGRGKLVHHYYEICGYNFLFREVEIEKTMAGRP
ncbi:MAG TPA: RDD family protein [Bryobacteraceae bacterium]|jgi:uncharacterized RDD family membrane protein YckC|nr:RDD family protein [Bryobacteraceae bacterium]